MPREKNNDELILKAATLYYTNGNTQDQIAKKFGFSRPTVVRLLKQARQKGFVEIKITRKLPHATHLETLIENEFASDNLLEVIVVENYDNDAKAAVAERAAQYLSQNLRQDHILGIVAEGKICAGTGGATGGLCRWNRHGECTGYMFASGAFVWHSCGISAGSRDPEGPGCSG